MLGIQGTGYACGLHVCWGHTHLLDCQAEDQLACVIIAAHNDEVAGHANTQGLASLR